MEGREGSIKDTVNKQAYVKIYKLLSNTQTLRAKVMDILVGRTCL